jgi:hypothetical protein
MLRHLCGRALLCLLMLGASSCGICLGTDVCLSDWRLQLVGRIVDVTTGAPVPGTRLDVTYSGAAGSATIVVTTDAEGRWSAQGAANCCDQFRASVVVSPPNAAPYFVPDFPVRTLRVAGDAVLLPEWTSQPYVRFAASPLYQNVQAMPGAEVRFDHTAGVPLPGPLVASTDGAGTFRFDAAVDRLGEAVGVLTVTHSLLSSPVQILGFRMPVSHEYQLPRPVSFPVRE